MSTMKIKFCFMRIAELEAALSVECTPDTLYSISQKQNIPEGLRAHVWKARLNVENAVTSFEEIFDLPEQNVIREDCHQFVAKLGNEDEDKLSVVSDLESILTQHRKSLQGVRYERGNGWVELLLPLVALKLDRSDTFALFRAVSDRYVPRSTEAFPIFRLLLLYHDPQLCSFLDTKRITPELYAGSWFQSLFAATCNLPTVTAMWDLYFQQADPFFLLFLGLVMVINAREQLLSMLKETKSTLIEILTLLPCGLQREDVPDFCSLAQYYAAKTPTSFRENLEESLFCGMRGEGLSSTAVRSAVAQALCLSVSVEELIRETAIVDEDSPDPVRFFLVDCRPADQYNAGHLPTAFHLDSNLMLQEPMAFSTAVQGLLSSQRQALAAGNRAAGEHLCFLGCGSLHGDQYTHMVVASFLQKNTLYVSMVNGGYQAIHEYLGESVNYKLSEHSLQHCLVCLAESTRVASSETLDHQNGGSLSSNPSVDLLGKIGAVVKLKSAEVKGKLFEYIVNPTQTAAGSEARHVSSSDKLGKRYRNIAPVFSIDDDQEPPDLDSESQDGEAEVVSLATWLKRPDLLASFRCQEVKLNGYMYNSHLLVTSSHVFVLREDSSNGKGSARVVVRRPLSVIARITCKKRQPELITFKYGAPRGEELMISDMDRFLIPNAKEATSIISEQILKILESKDANATST